MVTQFFHLIVRKEKKGYTMRKFFLLLVVIVAFVCGDASIYSVDYVVADPSNPYIIKLQSDSVNNRLWLRSFPLYDVNFMASV